MNILWITNTIFPPLAEALGFPTPVVGGWMYSSLKVLAETTPHNEYAVATVWASNEFKEVRKDGIKYYLLPLNGKSAISYNTTIESLWKRIHNQFNPNIIHIHGSEFPHGLAYVNACGSENVVVSIQGLVSVCARYFLAGLSYKSILGGMTFRDFIKGGLYKEQRMFEKRGKFEIELLSKVKHIIGRTDWDKTHSWVINPEANYYHVGETLRDSFYNFKWDYHKCEPYSIFVSQANYPIKGLHMLLLAMPLIIREFPETKVYVAGSEITNKSWIHLTSYGKILKSIIKKNSLEDYIVFTGSLSESQMCERYLKSNLFVCCSAIENSPNSLGEAQMLGVPHLASFVGGIPEIVSYNSEILYRFEEYENLAKRICSVFRLKEKVNLPVFEKKMYERDENLLSLLNVYSEMQKS